MNKRHLMAAALAALCATAAPAVQAQDWPSKPIRIVVPYPAGGSIDALARLLAQDLQAANGWTVVVENKPGANGNTGTDAVAKSNDGHTLLLCDVGALGGSRKLRPGTGTRLAPSALRW